MASWAELCLDLFPHGPAGQSCVWIFIPRCEMKIQTPRKIIPQTPDALLASANLKRAFAAFRVFF
jgi:hypothetical protein